MKLHVSGEAVLNKNEIEAVLSTSTKEYLVTRPNIHRGHTLYEVNLREGTLDTVKYEKKMALFHEKKSKRKEQMMYKVRPHCIYFPALNEETAFKKFVKIQNNRGISVKEMEK